MYKVQQGAKWDLCLMQLNEKQYVFGKNCSRLFFMREAILENHLLMVCYFLFLMRSLVHNLNMNNAMQDA